MLAWWLAVAAGASLRTFAPTPATVVQASAPAWPVQVQSDGYPFSPPGTSRSPVGAPVASALALGFLLAPPLAFNAYGAKNGKRKSWERSRRQRQYAEVVHQEISEVIRHADHVGKQRIPDGVQEMIYVVECDVSPDLANARVQVSIAGERKDKISAMRWLRYNAAGLRYEFAKRNRHMKSIPNFSFEHVDVGAATDMMVRLEEIRSYDEAAALARGDSIDDDDDENAWLAGEDEDNWIEEDEDSLPPMMPPAYM
jgi:ribosome-binding factor A